MGVYVARAGLSFSSRKRPELPRMPSAPRITTFPPVPVTCDAVRNKCRELLTAALQTDRECPGGRCTAYLGVLTPDTHPDFRGGPDSAYPQRPEFRGSWGTALSPSR